jgi:hypothetical protein
MADTSPKKKVAAKPKKPAAHPKYSEMVGKAIAALNERGGSSRQAILKYIMANFNVGKDAKAINVHLKLSFHSDLDLTSRNISTVSRNQTKSTNGFTCRTGSTSSTRRDRRTEINLGLTS